MKIPKNAADRDAFYEDLIAKCTASQEDRNTDYGRLRHFYLFGRAPDGEDTPYNKTYSHIDTLTAFLFASETTKFEIHLGPEQPELEYKRIPALSKAVQDKWMLSGADSTFGGALPWALTYNTMLVKLIHRVSQDGHVEISPFMVDPGCFGVLREDLPNLERQEAMVHTYYTTKSQLEIDLADHPHKAAILKYLSGSPRPFDEKPSGLQRILLSSSSPNMMGNVNAVLNQRSEYRPKVDEELIVMQELWVWDDEAEDYRVVTRGENGITIYDRKNFYLAGENPFTQICPNPMYSYFWGISEVDGLAGLQTWRNDRIVQMKKLLDLQVAPPTALTGWMGILDEKDFAMNMPGSLLSTDSMQAKVEKFKPEIPQAIFEVVHEIDASFAEQSGLQNIFMGKGESGVRSGRQTSELARLGSARIKKRALVIEDALEELATQYLKLMRKYDTTKYIDEDGVPFTADQFTDEFVVKVDAHSNSPIFIEDKKQLAAEMLEVHAIDRDSFIEMIDPPGKEMLKRKLKLIEAKEEKAAQAQQQAEAQKEEQKHLKVAK